MITPLTTNLNVHQGLPNRPNANDGLTPEEVKVLFDQAPNDIKDYINNTLLPELPVEFVSKTELTNTRKLSAAGDFTGTWNGLPFAGSDPGLNSIVAGLVAEFAKEVGTVFNIVGYGAIGDGVTDNTIAIQAAIDAAYADSGGIVYVPSGNFRITSQIILKEGVSLRGSGSGSQIKQGSCLYIDNSLDEAIILHIGTSVEGVNFFYPNQTNTDIGIDVPYVYPALFALADGGVNGIMIRQCYFTNVYYVADFTKPHGTITVKDCSGYAMYRGFVTDNCTDVERYENIHFNPAMWIDTFAPSDRSQWTRANGYCFHVKRSDWIKIINCFGWGYSKGIYVENGTSGSIGSGEFDKCGFDMCLTPIHVNASNAWGISITNCSLVAQDPIDTTIQHTAIAVENWAYALTIVNNKIWASTGNGISVAIAIGSPNQLIIDGNQILSYGVANSGATVYAIFIQNMLGAIVSNNHINGNSRSIARGILVNSCPNLSLKNNILRNMAEYGIILGQNAGQPIQDFYIVKDNIYRGSGVALLDNGTGLNKTVTGNLSGA